MAKGPYDENLGGKLNSNTPAQPAAAALEDQEQAEHEAGDHGAGQHHLAGAAGGIDGHFQTGKVQQP